ncbi:flagellar hook-basal body complex protein [Roseospira marina]|uniref:Flagellar hook protein FlgE n=1 Tax=Roseospira marina TaxID=140057 RepID=A0A5M6I373_9PROT|nr:flagellar hook-basal body complex protein [Roseospira marina]KAA5602613.1 flagellar hook-basal body complex protein [Roseospira marina]MBB4316274.1 flagellar hook protein FlgE [Roseospira marina]MBB5089468.1 flagellar hook protein FlgE [Roseospira marina]
MSLYGALFSGVSGLQSQSSAMGAISDNVANVNTVGYKGTTVNFKTLVTAQVSLTQYSPGGVQSAPRTNVDIQGLLQATTSSTDFGLSGGGFFVVSDQATNPSGYAFSRAGSFKIDKDGFLQNAAGYYLQGWPLDTWDGTVTAATVDYNNQTYMKTYKNENGESFYINDNAVDNVNMRPLNLSTIGGTARATSTLSMGAKLPADAAIGRSEQTNALIFDSLGNSHNLLYTWTKRDQNTWDVEVMPPAGSTYVSVDAQEDSTYYAAGRLDFTAVPDAGTSVEINGQTYTFTDSGSGSVDTINGNTVGTSLSLLLDELAAQVDADFVTAAGGTVAGVSGKSSPSSWVERIEGENSILIRQFSETAAINIDTTGLTTNGGLDPAVIQTGESGNPNAPWSIPALSPAVVGGWQGSWVTAGTSAMTFNGDGTPDTIFGYDETAQNDPRSSISLGWANGSLNMDGGSINTGGSPAITQFWGNYNADDGFQQLSGEYQLNFVSQNGNRFGNYAGISVSEDGIVTALFDNGVQRPIFMIPVATFVNPNGMNPLTGNVFQQTDDSGLPVVREAGSAGAASVAQATLENSTVDLGTEFTNMITTQRAYSAASKIITTSDDMLEELIRIKQ